MTRAEFVAAYGAVYESSPWIAERTYDRDPQPADVAAALRATVDQATREEQLALIRAHPDLAGRAALAGELTPASASEQASAGLDRLDPDTHARLTDLTARYADRFGFPFVICVREHTVQSIVAQAERRLAHDPETEREAAIAEIHKIASLRLSDR